MSGDEARQVAPDEALLRLVHSLQVVPDGRGGRRLSSAALVFPRVPLDNALDGVSVYVEGTVNALGRQASDLIGERGFDEVWSAQAAEVSAATPCGVVEDPVDEGFWADPAHALIVTPANSSNGERKKLARSLSPMFAQLSDR